MSERGPEDPRTGGAAAAPRPGPAVPVLTGVVLVALLVAMGAVVQLGLAPAALPAGGATRFVAADGLRGFAAFSAGGKEAPAMVENALLTGSQIVSGVPGGMFARTAPAPGVDQNRAHWWRESVVVSGSEEPASRYRLRSVSADGVRLHGQSWGRSGMTFEPALLELPADVAAGASWQSQGRAVGDPDQGILSYRYSATAERPAAAEDADAGCLRISSRTEMQPEHGAASTGDAARWTETQLWCPGQGVVADSGDFRGTLFELGRSEPTIPATLRSAALEPATPSAGELSGWRQGTLQVDDGDPTFGSHPTTVDTNASMVAATGAGTLNVVNSTERDVNVLTPLTSGRFWGVGWLHPGAQITSVADVGNLVVLTTSDRRLMAYDFGGRLRWSEVLPEVAVVPAVAVTGDRLLVATLGGQVGVYDTLTGRQRWQHDVGSAVTAGLSSGAGLALIVGADATLHALDLSDGHEEWNTTVFTAGTEAMVIGDRVVVFDYSRLTGLDLGTGRVVWELTGLGDTQTLRRFGDVAVVVRSGDVSGYSPVDGSLRWRREGAVLDACRYGDQDFLLGRDSITAVDDSGRDRHRWTVDVDLGDRARLLTDAGVLWAVGHDDDGMTGVWIGDREPGS